MSNTTQQLDQFRQFALSRLSTSGCELSIDELYDEWRRENPAPEEMAQNEKAIAASLRDLDQGVSRKPAADFVRQFKSKLLPE